MDGIIVIDKEEGYTSRDVVNIIGKKYKTKKVGHTGTLDPLATGVLVVCVGKATKIAELLTAADKEYIAEFKFGCLTDTLDITGKVLENEDAIIEKEEVLKVINNMLGSQEQTIPLYSAVKINGKKLYEYARDEEEIELPKHLINIKEMELLNIDTIEKQTIIKLRVLVSKGTYIRSIARDMGIALGTYGTMTSLRRTKQGDFTINKARTLGEVDESTNLIPITRCLDDYKLIYVSRALEEDLLDGKIINNIYGTSRVLFCDTEGTAIALYKEYDKDSTKIKPWKMFKIRK